MFFVRIKLGAAFLQFLFYCRVIIFYAVIKNSLPCFAGERLLLCWLIDGNKLFCMLVSFLFLFCCAGILSISLFGNYCLFLCRGFRPLRRATGGAPPLWTPCQPLNKALRLIFDQSMDLNFKLSIFSQATIYRNPLNYFSRSPRS